MPLLLKYLPTFHFEERHSIMVSGEPATVLDTVEDLEPGDDRLIRFLIAVRQLPDKIAGRRPDGGEAFGLKDFTFLERSDGQLAYGLVGRFWRLDFGLERIADGLEFQVFSRPGVAKLLMSFEAELIGEGQTKLSTRTRIFCPDRSTRLPMTAYWAAIRPASGFIRRRMLCAVKAQAEAAD